MTSNYMYSRLLNSLVKVWDKNGNRRVQSGLSFQA